MVQKMAPLNGTFCSENTQRKENCRGSEMFDIVIGNPPYGATLSYKEKQYCKQRYKLKTSETAILFIEKGLRLCKKDGINAYVIPKPFTYASNYEKTRSFVEMELQYLIDCGRLFENVKFEACVIFLLKNKNITEYKSFSYVNKKITFIGNIHKKLKTKFGFFPNGITEKEATIGIKIKDNSIFLNDIADNSRGDMFQKCIQQNGKLPVIGGKEIDSYGINGVKGFLDTDTFISEKAVIKHHSILVQNIVAHTTKPYSRIKITACIPNRMDYLIVDTINQITITDKNIDKKIVWALLNSTLVNWYAYLFIFAKAIRTMHFDNFVTSRIPIPNRILEYQQLIINIINSKIDNMELENEIDMIVYKLYDLTYDEVKIIDKNFFLTSEEYQQLSLIDFQ